MQWVREYADPHLFGAACIACLLVACGDSGKSTSSAQGSSAAGATGGAAGHSGGVSGAAPVSGAAGVLGGSTSTAGHGGHGGAGGSLTCAAGLADCDGVSANGCEVTLATDPANCGACGTACGSANAVASCNVGACTLTCSTGFADCNTAAGDGCETDLATDAKNCGWCGHTCGKAACGDSVCEPEVVATATNSEMSARVVFDGTDFFWLVNPTATSCQVLKTDLSGTTTVLYTLLSTKCLTNSLAVSPANVYLGARDGSIWWVPKLASSRAGVIYTDPLGYPDRITIDGNNLFFVAAGTLKRIYADGTGSIELTVPYLADFLAFGGQLYFAANDQVTRVDTSLGNQTMVMPVLNGTTAYTSLAVDANDVYISTRGLGYICRAMPGANASCATYDGIDATGLALTPDAVYVTAEGGTVHRADRPPPFVPSWSLLANSGGCVAPGTPVVVGDYVYWLCIDTLLRTPR